jgi:hypothetical protein
VAEAHDITIAPLTAVALEATIDLCGRVSPWDRDEAAEGLRAVLAPHRHPSEIRLRSSFDRTCWVGEAAGGAGPSVEGGPVSGHLPAIANCTAGCPIRKGVRYD